MKIADIYDILNKGLSNPMIEIYDLSDSHKNHFESFEDVPSHLKIVIKSKDFNDLPLLKAHRKVKDLLKDAFDRGMHSASIQTLPLYEL
jgi:stress-induced morphogen